VWESPGTTPVAYQWCLNGAPLWEATNSSLLITNSQSIDAGLYNVIVTNISGAATSTVATLTVLFPPSIVTQFHSQRVLQGNSLEFTLSTEGTQPFAFQWLFNSVAMPGKTGASLLLSNVQPADAGEYSVTVSNMVGDGHKCASDPGCEHSPSVRFELSAHQRSPSLYAYWNARGTNI
jgi:hypothetical protein